MLVKRHLQIFSVDVHKVNELHKMSFRKISKDIKIRYSDIKKQLNPGN